MTRKIAFIGLFSALAIILGYIESLIPFFPGLQGVKLGLANLSVLYLMKTYSTRDAVIVNVIRILTIGWMFGSMFSILYSFAGALLSMLIMHILCRKKNISVCAISMAGGIAHNIGQLIVAVFVLRSSVLIWYTPVLVLSGIGTGFLTGIITSELIRRIPVKYTDMR